MLYRIEQTSLRIAALADASPSSATELPTWLKSALNQSDKLLLQSDLRKIDPASSLLPPNQSLTVLSFFGDVTALWTRLALPGHPARMKVWAVCEQLLEGLSEFSPRRLEQTLATEAEARPLAHQFLENPQAMTEGKDAVPLGEQIDRLVELVRVGESAGVYETVRYQAWQAGNQDALTQLQRAQLKAFPEMSRLTVGDVALRWMGAVRDLAPELASSVRIMLALPVSQLCGPGGVLTLLAAEGRTVTRLL